MSNQLLLTNNFVDRTERVLSLGSSHRISFSRALFDACRRLIAPASFDLELLIIRQAVSQIDSRESLPAFLSVSGMHPYLCASTSGGTERHFYVSESHEAPSDIDTLLQLMRKVFSFHEYRGKRVAKWNSHRVFFSRRLKYWLTKQPLTRDGFSLGDEILLIAYLTSQSRRPFWTWGYGSGRIGIFHLLDDNNRILVYHVMEHEIPEHWMSRLEPRDEAIPF